MGEKYVKTSGMTGSGVLCLLSEVRLAVFTKIAKKAAINFPSDNNRKST